MKALLLVVTLFTTPVFAKSPPCNHETLEEALERDRQGQERRRHHC